MRIARYSLITDIIGKNKKTEGSIFDGVTLRFLLSGGQKLYNT